MGLRLNWHGHKLRSTSRGVINWESGNDIYTGGTVVKNPPATLGDARDSDLIPGKISWSRKWQTTPIFLPAISHEQKSLAGYSPRGCKESDTTERWSTRTCVKEITKAYCKHRTFYLILCNGLYGRIIFQKEWYMYNGFTLLYSRKQLYSSKKILKEWPAANRSWKSKEWVLT